jgi:hypothetical protein
MPKRLFLSIKKSLCLSYFNWDKGFEFTFTASAVPPILIRDLPAAHPLFQILCILVAHHLYRTMIATRPTYLPG